MASQGGNMSCQAGNMSHQAVNMLNQVGNMVSLTGNMSSQLWNMSSQAGNLSSQAENPKDQILKVSSHYFLFWLKYSYEKVCRRVSGMGWGEGWELVGGVAFVQIKEQQG